MGHGGDVIVQPSTGHHEVEAVSGGVLTRPAGEDRSGGPADGTTIGPVRPAVAEETVGAVLVGVTGSVRRPEALLVRLPDGRQEVTAPRLTPAQSRRLAVAIAGRLRPSTGEGRTARVHWLARPQPLVEVVVGTGRDGRVRFVRARPQE